MSEQNQDTPGQQGDPEGLGDAGKKALQAERARAEQAEKRLRDVEAALQAEQDKHAETIKSLEDRLTEGVALAQQAVAERDRFQVAYSKNVPADLMEFLKGTTPDELAESADKLMTHVNAPKTPKPDPLQGSSGNEPPANPGRELLNQIFKNP